MEDWIYTIRLHVDGTGYGLASVGATHPVYGDRTWDTVGYRTSDFTRTQHRVVEELWIAVSNLMERYTYEL